jgi:CheY-like chemotaxis protein
MNAGTPRPFRLEPRELQASALRAQVIERTRRTLNHDLNNAVQSIHSGLELLSKCVGSPVNARVTPQECIALVKQQVVTMQNAFHEMLALLADPPGDPEAVDLSALVSDSLKMIRHERAVAKARLRIEPGVWAHARTVNIRILTVALLLEASDRSPPNDVLTIEVLRLQGRASLKVLGRASNTAEENGQLTLTQMLQSVAAAENGELTIDQSDGERFLHLMLPAVTKIEALDEGSKIPAEGPLRVLIADRNKDAADSLAMILHLEGHEARASYSGTRILEMVREFSPHIVLLDSDLPDCDPQVASAIADTQQGRVLVQVSGAGQSRNSAYDAHLVRPVEWPQLQMLLSSVRPNK